MRRGVLCFVREHNGTIGACMEACTMQPAVMLCVRIVVGFFKRIEFLLELSDFRLQRHGVCHTEGGYWGKNGSRSIMHCSSGENSIARMEVTLICVARPLNVRVCICG